MKYKIGESVRVKSYEKIQETLDENYYLKGYPIFFNDEMKKHCGRIYIVKSYASFGPYYILENCGEAVDYWQWPKEWLEPVNRFKKSSLAVVRPDLVSDELYGHDTFVRGMTPTKGTIVEIKNIDPITGSYNIKENH